MISLLSKYDQTQKLKNLDLMLSYRYCKLTKMNMQNIKVLPPCQQNKLIYLNLSNFMFMMLFRLFGIYWITWNQNVSENRFTIS